MYYWEKSKTYGRLFDIFSFIILRLIQVLDFKGINIEVSIGGQGHGIIGKTPGSARLRLVKLFNIHEICVCLSRNTFSSVTHTFSASFPMIWDDSQAVADHLPSPSRSVPRLALLYSCFCPLSWFLTRTSGFTNSKFLADMLLLKYVNHTPSYALSTCFQRLPHIVQTSKLSSSKVSYGIQNCLIKEVLGVEAAFWCVPFLSMK